MAPINPVLQLCGKGMQAEAEGRAADAEELFRQAWKVATDDYDACVAAHYVARHQKTPDDTLRWNQECLDRADRVGDDRVRGFYPSLHVNLGRAHQELGHRENALDHYRRGRDCIKDVPPGPYADGLRFAIAVGLRATGESMPDSRDDLAELIALLCARANLPALGILIPAYLGDLGTADDHAKLLTAMHMVHGGRSLGDDELALLRRAIAARSRPATA